MNVPRRLKKKPVEYSDLHLSVEHYDASLRAGVNNYAHSPHTAWNLDDRDPVYEFGCSVTLLAKLIYPDRRSGEIYHLTFYSADAPSDNLSVPLKDIQVRDKKGIPEYREYRHREIPVYSPPKGLAHLNKTRGQPRWTAWVRASGRFVTDMLTLLRNDKRLYVVIYERKDDRAHWIQSLHIQTQDPAEE